MDTRTTHLLSYLFMCTVLFMTKGCSPTYYSSDHGDTGIYQDSGAGNGVDLKRIEENLRGDQVSQRNGTLRMRSNLSGGYTIEDSSGIKQGELEKQPGGDYKITNSIGKELGELERKPGGGYNIENQFGRDVGNVERNNRGGYDIKGPYGRELKRVDSDIGGGYDIKDISDEER